MCIHVYICVYMFVQCARRGQRATCIVNSCLLSCLRRGLYDRFSIACGRLASLWLSLFFGLCLSYYHRNTDITGLTACPTLTCIWRIHTQVLRLEGQILFPTHCWAIPPALKMRRSTHPPCHCFACCVSLVVLTSSVVMVADLQPVLM